MEPLKVRVGEVIRRRREPNYSQEGFADFVGVHRTYMGRVERGRVNISIDNLERIARALDVPVSTLLHDAEALGPAFVAPGGRPARRRPTRRTPARAELSTGDAPGAGPGTDRLVTPAE